ncbi:MAG: hypothetical protein U0R19_37870 [Bryobacteraceae bacterium]
MSNIWRGVPVGTIVDDDLLRLGRAGGLIVDCFDEKCVKQACYELRASEIFYEVQSSAEDKRIVVGPGDGYLLKPHCQIVSIVRESVSLPSNVLGRILTKGHLFSIGILPVNTYADPGFEGRLGITLYNASHRYIYIQPDEPIAKIEFTVLPKSVTKPYSGQHGYETKIWPVVTSMYADPKDPKFSARIGSSEKEIEASHGPRIAKMARQLRYYRYGVWLQLLVMTVGFGIIFFLYGHLSFFSSVLIGILSNVLTAVLMNVCFDRLK